jgi:hypothetical protein
MSERFQQFKKKLLEDTNPLYKEFYDELVENLDNIENSILTSELKTASFRLKNPELLREFMPKEWDRKEDVVEYLDPEKHISTDYDRLSPKEIKTHFRRMYGICMIFNAWIDPYLNMKKMTEMLQKANKILPSSVCNTKMGAPFFEANEELAEKINDLQNDKEKKLYLGIMSVACVRNFSPTVIVDVDFYTWLPDVDSDSD